MSVRAAQAGSQRRGREKKLAGASVNTEDAHFTSKTLAKRKRVSVREGSSRKSVSMDGGRRELELARAEANVKDTR